jgi:aspartyl-tRNA(Asn)/glutamyl-tRNA(Gln) amidotransferase subunit C
VSLERSDIENIALLARLSMKEDKIPDYQKELGNILEMVKQMNNVNTDDISPLAHPLEIIARLREDSVTETNQRDKNQKIAPEVDSGFYLVPKVID